MKLSAKDYILVGLQILLFIAVLWDWKSLRFNSPALFIGIGAMMVISGAFIVLGSLLQLNTNLSVFPTPKVNSSLIDTGLYKWVRHPIYSGILIGFLGYALFTHSGYRIIITILLLILFYFKSSYEEQKLSQKFSRYHHYKKKNRTFLSKN